MSDSKEMSRFEALAEEAFSRIYDARERNAKECLEDALYNLSRAIDIAEMRGFLPDVDRLKKRHTRFIAARQQLSKARS